jgi:phage terminase large subunit-like protein
MVNVWPELEKEMVNFDPESTRESPDRMDAMVHACIKLMAGERRQMRIGYPGTYDFQLDQSMYDLGRLI